MTNSLLKKFERLNVDVYSSSTNASRAVAERIAAVIRDKQSKNQNAVLGLATGSTPTRMYAELIRMHKKEGLSFKNVITFNLDEYYPMDKTSIHSYNRFMREYLFDHIDIPEENIHIPDGTLPRDEVDDYCVAYEEKIRNAGGLDIQVLGIGRTGHIGFNEPGSMITSRTRLINLDAITRIDAASDFFGKSNVPRTAITMGIGTIMDAREIILMAWGEGKASIVQKTVEGNITELIPASFLQNHKNVSIVLDTAAANELTRVKTPWLLGPVDWDTPLIKKAVVWLCEKVQKPVLKLVDEDYNEHGMADLITERGNAYNTNIEVFNLLQHTITGWPGGKPNADDSQRPERSTPFPKRAIIFSPHPDDDVISMGGTLLRLVDQGHEVHVAYQTSGNIAVFDDYAFAFMEFARDFNVLFNFEDEKLGALYNKTLEFLEHKKPGEVDTPEIKNLKGLIRKVEAKAGCRFCGVDMKNVHFLDLPFYETGTVKKNPIGPEDIRITKELIQKVKPHQIYVAGDLSDPHGTHRVCLKSVFEAYEELKDEDWIRDCKVWMYRGAWQEWDIADIEMAVPLSPQEVIRKRQAIFKHQSQKDSALFPGNDKREFWQRAEDRNKATAVMYDKLGLAEYEAMEAFVEWDYQPMES